MKKLIYSAFLFASMLLSGCGNIPFVTSAPNPAYVTATTTPAGTTIMTTNLNVPPIVFEPSPTWAAVSNMVSTEIAPVAAAITAATPAAPIAPVIPTAANYLLAGISALLGGLAAWKNSQANQHARAAAALAATVVQTGTAAAALNNAAANGSSGTVAQHLANAQSPV